VYSQITGRFDLVAILVSEGGHQKHLLKLTHRFLVLDAAFVHLHYEGFEVCFHGGLRSSDRTHMEVHRLHAPNQHLYLLWTEMNARATKNCHAKVQVRLNRSEIWLRY